MASHESLQPAVYQALRARAARVLQGENGTLSPTSLVHDVLVKVYRSHQAEFQDENHFRAVASLAMRQILIDRARRKASQKHGANAIHVGLSQVGAEGNAIDILALQQAMEQLEGANPRAAKVVQLKVFGGLDLEGIASQLKVSESTVKRDWRVGSAWIQLAMSR